jgi:hypothetical protein
MEPRPINRDDVILENDIPAGADRVVIITYHGKSLLVSYDDYENGDFRKYFIQHFGFPPPVSGSVSKKFSPNIEGLL